MLERQLNDEVDMPIIDLSQILIGDVLLEPGNNKIAKHTGSEEHQFGHASLALGRLAKIHAPGPGKAVCIEAFGLQVWRREGEKLIGCKVEGDAWVLRSGEELDAATILGEAQWYSGIPYANAEKLSQLHDLSPEAREFLNSEKGKRILNYRAGKGIQTASEGVSCGELVGKILFPDEPDFSPNSLIEDDNLHNISGVVISENGWDLEGEHELANTLSQTLANIQQDLSQPMFQKLKYTAKHLTSNKEKQEFLKDFEDNLTTIISTNTQALRDVKKLEGAVFGL